MAAKTRPEKDKSTITLKESQRLSLMALENQHEQTNKELKALQAQSEKLKGEIQSRVNILAENRSLVSLVLQEIESDQELAKDSLSTGYVFDGKDFVKAGN